MSIPWISIAFIEPDWHQNPTPGEERNVTDAVRIGRIPEWMQALPADDPLRVELRDQLGDGYSDCLLTTYDAPAAGFTSSAVKGVPLESPQEAAVEEFRRATLSLWLVRRTSLSFAKVVHAERLGDEWVWRQVVSFDSRSPLPAYLDAEHSSQDFEEALVVARALKSAKRGGSIHTATQSVYLALTQQGWALRFLALWLAVEGLFGPEDGREITFRLSQRVALFLEPRGPSAIALSAQIKKSYHWRSKTVHGMRLAKLKDDEAAELIDVLEEAVRRSIRKILTDETQLALFDGSSREQYLDELALR